MKKLLLLLLMTCCGSLGAYESPQALQDAFLAGMNANDSDALADCYTEDAVSYSIDDLAGVGPDYVRDAWDRFFSGFVILDASLYESELIVMGDTAMAWGLFKILARPKAGGEPVEMKGRYTDVARNMNGNWLYIFDHASVPMPGG